MFYILFQDITEQFEVFNQLNEEKRKKELREAEAAEARFLSVVEVARKNYLQNMNQERFEDKPCMTIVHLKEIHQRHEENAFKCFYNLKKLGDEKLCEKYFCILKDVRILKVTF